MNVFTTQFHACEPMPWKGRYGRVMGDRAVFHLRRIDGRLWPVLLWETTDYQPHGVSISDDGKTLFMADTPFNTGFNGLTILERVGEEV